MARFPVQFQSTDAQGKIIVGETVTLYRTGTTYAITCYAASTGGSAVPDAVFTTDSDGRIKAWIDDEDYPSTQYFRIQLTGSKYKTQTVDDVVVLPVATTGHASTALDDLASVAINTSLISDTADTDNLGSEVIPWAKLFLGSGGISFEGSTDDTYQTTVVSTDTTGSDKTITLPNATGTVSLITATETLTNKTLTGNTAVNLISGSGTVVLNTTGTMTLPNATDTVVGKATTDTLTNKTLGASTLSGQMTGADQTVSAVNLKDYGEITNANGAAGTTETLSMTDGNVHHMTLDENIEFTAFDNATASGEMCSFTLILRQDGSGTNTVTWPGSVDWEDGTAPTLTTTASAVSILSFFTIDGGIIWHGVVGSDNSS